MAQDYSIEKSAPATRPWTKVLNSGDVYFECTHCHAPWVRVLKDKKTERLYTRCKGCHREIWIDTIK